ncbi:hypothetical protein EVG20_g4882 [Dentipellis fragilis]|uniref:GH16 domain-containing protein n=1 Tax=Dentipellis fragilis TaxID=205917 RepID=A0A4Y9YYK5_9AGAM|nr:hypothetical protein EVG20_g4882 [Dentipellis fragilis]
MHLPTTLLLLVLSQGFPVDAQFSAGHIVKRTADRFHTVALKHSAGLARDIRTAFKGMLVAQPPVRVSVGITKPYCVSSKSGGVHSGFQPATNGTNSNPSPTTSGKPGKPTGTSTSSGASPSSTFTSDWKLVQSYAGNSFFNGWTFWDQPDPTHGTVQYVNSDDASSGNLTSINSAGNAIMRVDTTPQVSGNRKSVRIQTNFSYTGGLVVLDSVHMPTGCGTWPAFWSNGPNWPAGGEIDIVEGVNDYTNNQATIHTNPGCNMPSSNTNTLDISGSVVGGTNCAAAQTGNQGCGVRASQTNSFGAAFNSIGGGVYAMQWDNSGVSVFFFPRSSIPADITAGAPNPDNWGAATARWPASSCNPFQFFQDHSAIFDTTLCGDWASGVWGATGVPGQEQSCAQRTGVSTCEAFVANNGAAFSEAYWEVKSVKIYQTK